MMSNSGIEARDKPYHEANLWFWLSPLLFMAVAGLYAVIRYSGQWAEADSATFTKLIRTFWADGRLVPTVGPGYPNGYGYQAVSSFIMAVTGLDVATLQQLMYPLLAAIVALPAWVLYRELTESALGATLATALLLTQPEFLFVTLRSSHEKFTRALMLLCLFLLVRSFRFRDRPWSLAAHVCAFYLLAYAFIVSNNLIAHSFIFAVAMALVLGRILERRDGKPESSSSLLYRRLSYITLSCLILVYIFTFYVYAPARHDLSVLQNIFSRVAALFLDVQRTGGQEATNAYVQVQAGWISLYVYFLVSLANWIVLAASFAIWAHQALNWLGRHKAPGSQAAQLLWLFYAAFAAQGALSAISDASGALGSNLQHRLFPSFSIVAVAMVSAALCRWQPRRYVKHLRLGVAACMFSLAVLSLFKATNEPLVSNKWTFYRAAELAAMDWSTGHLKNVQIWTEYDERLLVAYDTVRGDPANGDHLEGYGVSTITRNRILTDITRLRSSRLNVAIPVPPDALCVYDNGEAQVYHLRPQTPYEP